MNSRFHRFSSRLFRSVPLLISAFMFPAQFVSAQTGDEGDDAPTINIVGDVYGGGKEGSVGIGNLDASLKYTAEEAQTENAKHLDDDPAGRKPVDEGYVTTYKADYTPVSAGDAKPVSKDDVNLDATYVENELYRSEVHTTNVIINDGNVRTVFGGGQNGRVYGLSTAAINGGVIGAEKWNNTIHGGVFGAGDGESAYLFGVSHVLIAGGTIYNNVYGGGNQADVIGSAATRLDGGTIYGNVFGSARMADVKGYTNVVIASDQSNKSPLYVKAVFGGNDISGIAADFKDMVTHLNANHWLYMEKSPAFVGKATTTVEGKPEWMPYELGKGTDFYGAEIDVNVNAAMNKTAITNNTLVSNSVKDKTVFIGTAFAGGNGDYTYSNKGTDGTGTVKLANYLVQQGDEWVLPGENVEGAWSSFSGLKVPDTERAYLQLEGGTFGYVYGGGNNATVSQVTDIYINNPDDPCRVPKDVIKRMGLQTSTYFWAKEEVKEGGEMVVTKLETEEGAEFATFPQTFDRVFGGNNLATMSIAPNWYLHEGRVNNLYGGGNKGAMTCENGILVYVFQNTDALNTDGTIDATKANRMKINNLYAGCRMANVSPYVQKKSDTGTTILGDTDTKVTEIAGFTKFGHEFPANYASRVYVTGGSINNVYGGNDISGQVMVGADVEISGAISGDVYGGGNGAYPYTDNVALAQAYPEEYGDYYYDKDGGLDFEKAVSAGDGTASLAGLYKKRPHVENTLVHIAGEGQWIPNDNDIWENMIQWDSSIDATRTAHPAAVKVDFTPTGTITRTVNGKDVPLKTWKEVKGSDNGMVLTKGEMYDINRVYVTGGVYCGGNSATVANPYASESDKTSARATLKIGQCVTIDKVFLGSNGANMVDLKLLNQYAAENINGKGKLAQFDLTNSEQMAEYMKGCAMNIMPAVDYDNPDQLASNGDELDVSVDPDADMDEQGLNFSARIGSFFVGGNVGSLTVDGTIGPEGANGKLALKFPRELVIYDKVVGGCNAANIPYLEGVNAFYQGGLTGTPGSAIANAGDNDPGLKLHLYIPCRMEPRVLSKETDADGYVHVNTEDPEPWSAPTVISDHGIESDVVGPVQILDRGNIYGGCYESGYVNGSVLIEIKDELCATPQMRAYFGDKPLLGQEAGQDGTAAVVDNMRRYVLNHGWSAFGGGYGEQTEIWGNVYMNMSRNAGYINAYGGGQKGFIGKIARYTEEDITDGKVSVTRFKKDTDGKLILGTNGLPETETVQIAAVPGDYKIEEVTTTTTTTTTTTGGHPVAINKYVVEETGNSIKGGHTYVNLKNDIHRSPVSIFGLNAIYGGGYEGVVTGNTHVYAGGGLHYDIFGGASNADIYGATEVYVGRDREAVLAGTNGSNSDNLQIRHNIYGGNDFGGQILGTLTHKAEFKNGETDVKKEVTSNTYVKYYGGMIERSIFGGSCGLYRYDGTYQWTGTEGVDSVLVGEQWWKPEKETDGTWPLLTLYPKNSTRHDTQGKPFVDSWTTMPTLFNTITAPESAPDGYEQVVYNSFVDIDCQTDNPQHDAILNNIYGGGYGMCDAVGRVDARDTYVLLRSKKEMQYRLADNVFGGGYFSFVKNSTLDAVSGRYSALYGGTFGTTVDAAVADSLNVAAKVAAVEQKTQWGTSIESADYDTYRVLQEINVTQLQNADYTSEQTIVNVYPDLTAYENVDVYGAGAYTGADNTHVTLYGGKVRNVYGGSNQEGVCLNTLVDVPESSTVSMAALFGGSHGSYLALPCDVKNATINFLGNNAVVTGGKVFGGNNEYRATRNTYINYNAKARTSTSASAPYLTIYGAGNGASTVAGQTHVNIGRDAIAYRVFGGGYAGNVFCKYDILEDILAAGATKPAIPEAFTAKGENETVEAFKARANDRKAYWAYHDASEYDRYEHHVTETVDGQSIHTGNSYAHWYLPDEIHTNITLVKGATIMSSVYGAGEGATSVVAGKTNIDCYGAFVTEDIFGGGLQGNIRKMRPTDTGYQLYDTEDVFEVDENFKRVIDDDTDTYKLVEAKLAEAGQDDYIVSTNINMYGGNARDLFGGGYEGYVGEPYATKEETAADGTKTTVIDESQTANHDFTAVTTVNVGAEETLGDYTYTPAGEGATEVTLRPGEAGYVKTTITSPTADDKYYHGIPAINFSVYGAGDRGPVYGTSNVNVYNGYVGFDYRQYSAEEAEAKNEGLAAGDSKLVNTTSNYYIDRVKVKLTDEDDLMVDDGNLFGGGFGEMAKVLNTNVNMYDGVIRNGLYGGGEVASVGWGFVKDQVDEATGTKERVLDKAYEYGKTYVALYGGLVQGDVFGGGRGWGYQVNGAMMNDETNYTDGYVFGRTDVNIFRGTVGTDYTLREENGAHGNVFGGGNVGYVYGNSHKLTAAEKTAIEAITDGQHGSVNKGLATTAGYYYRLANASDSKLTIDADGKTVDFAVDADGYMILSEDCRVSVKAYGMATGELSNLPSYTLSYERGQKVAEEYVGLLSSYIQNGVVTGNIYTTGTDENGVEKIYFGGEIETTDENEIATKDAKMIATIHHVGEDDTQVPHVHKVGERIDDIDEHLSCMNFLSHITTNNIITRDASVTITGNYAEGDYIPNEQLNQLKSPKDDATNWANIDQSGIVIRNSVFAGGNVIKGSDKVYAFANTVFGNATAALVDVFSCDLISVAGKGFGGLYGDGNLTFVDGYRELNITNYGTDFYNLNDKIGETGDFNEEYQKLSAREKDFYTIRYQCTADGGTTIGEESKQVHYNKGDEIDQKIYDGLTDDQKKAWKATAAKINEGRTLNTVQRANYCGIKGSRIVLYGAIDRAQSMDEVDYTNYSINRVGELSLNRNYGTGNNPGGEEHVHGSYFGIYNIVKQLSSMSSDYDFFAGLTKKPSHRTTASPDAEGTGMKADISKDWFATYQASLDDADNPFKNYSPKTSITYGATDENVGSGENQVVGYNPYSFFNWKADNAGEDERNDGTVANKVALASGVYLELVESVDATSGAKDYGPVIGVVELDLLNVTPGEGGGYVYAENNHGMPHFSTEVSYATILADANQGLKTVRGYYYTPASGTEEAESGKIDNFNGIVTSGNFVSSTKTIIDDCFPAHGDLKQDCHYWYISGNVYVHEQLISAYTGGAGKYTAELTLPISLDNKMNANLRLVNILPGLYVNPTNMNYNGEKSDTLDITFAGAITKQYGQGDAISYWDWYNIQDQTLKNSFLITTYMCKEDITIGEGENAKTFRRGQSISQEQYCKDVLGLVATTSFPTIPEGKEDIAAHFVAANEINKGTGYYLTMNMSNPEVWGDYYTKSTTGGIESITEAAWNKLEGESKNDYKKDITFVCTTAGVYGQDDYPADRVISKSEYDGQDDTYYILEDLSEASWIEGSGTLITAEEYATKSDDEKARYKPANKMTMEDYEHVPESLRSEIYLAIFENTYVAKEACSVNGTEYVVGAVIPSNVYNKMDNTDKDKFEQAYVCVNPIAFSESDYYIRNQVIGQKEFETVKNKPGYKNNFESAYYCAKPGQWGGKKYEAGEVYTADDYDNLNADERQHFRFTYDALSLLETYYYQSAVKGQTEMQQLEAINTIGASQNLGLQYYDVLYGTDPEKFTYTDTPAEPTYGTPGRYSQYKLLDITATPTDKIMGYTVDEDGIVTGEGFTYKPDPTGSSTVPVKQGGRTLTSAEYNNLPNDAKHFVKFSPKAEYKVITAIEGTTSYPEGTILSLEEYQALSDENKARAELNKVQYVVTNPFTKGNTYYPLGQVVDATLATDNPNVTGITLPDGATTDNTYYVCFEKYMNGENNGHIDGTVTSYTIGSDDSAITTNDTVPVGTIIDATTYASIPNYQKGFAISGVAPHEVTTLYVPKTADIENLQEDRYVTAIYEYQYDVDKDGQGSIERRIEKHIFNIHIQFMSGVPIVGRLENPSIVLPSEKVGLRVPNVNEGAFPVLSGGWELYKTEDQANAHNDGVPYVNNGTPMYWYQDGNWVAYYAETSNGRAYSNPVQIKVANYHKLTDVVEDTKNHMFVNHHEVKRDPKIYIEDNNDLNNLNTLFQATTGDKTTTTVVTTDENGVITQGEAFDQLAVADRREGGVKDCKGLEFFVMNDIEQVVTTNEQKKNAEGHLLYTTATGLETTDAAESDGTANAPVMVEVNVPWVPVGGTKNDDGTITYSDECFAGNLHGNGHALTGMENSLFYKMCGNVYNLGVAGSFTNGGVAELGGDNNRVENCWVWTTAKNSGDGAISGYAVVGDNKAGINNCFYPQHNGFTAGLAKSRPVDDFVNGQVAYDLNRYYLVARYGLEGPDITDPVSANAFYRNPDGTIVKAESGDVYKTFSVDYQDGDAYFTSVKSTTSNPIKLGYVEKYYEDGDFRYAEGLKPTTPDMRKTTLTGGPDYLPIFPDDYIFFGQKLTYGLYGDVAHDIFPVAAVKEKTHANGNEVDNSESGLLVEDDATSNRSNRIYRAPAYFQNGKFGRSAIFNKKAAFAASVTYEDFAGLTAEQIKEKTTIEANDFIKGCFTTEGQKELTFYPYQYMTAIDFTGSGDDTWTYASEWSNETAGYFKKLLDFDYLDDIKTSGITHNLLAYVSGATGTGHEKDVQTATVVTNYFSDPVYAGYYDKVKVGYRTVGIAPTENIKGHVVKAVEGATEGTVAYTATNDHLLVDKQDFNAPIAYTFANGKRMWYQRTPTNEHYATSMNAGWTSICLPFSAELVTTQQKGEITHFYGNDGTSNNDNSQTDKVGHEYWLREFSGKVSKSTETEELEVASFASLPAATGTSTKTYTNTFLWDYYYNVDGKDKNGDDYQTYYSKTQTYNNYPYSTAGTPYIIGLPGATYYEFDLSGSFTPDNTSTTATSDQAKLSAQTITFASNPEITINVSDNECSGAIVTKEGYSFVPTYLNSAHATSEEDGKSNAYYPMNAAGTAFDLNASGEGAAADFTSTAFRPYFVKTTTNTTPGAKEVTRSIIFNSDDKAIEENPFDERKGVDETNSMKIYVRGHKLVIESTYDATLNVYYINGQFVRKVDVKEGTNTYDGFRPGFYIVGNKKVNFAPGNY